MVLSTYFLKYPYRIIWRLLWVLKKNPEVVIYCTDPLDYIVLEPVLKYLPAIPIIVKNRKTADFIKKKGKDYKRYPSFPKAVIMSRHAAHKFPENKVIKIGFRHGAYHFKAFSKAQYYNAFDVYFVTSQKEVKLAKEMGITSTEAIGFPKLDPAFNDNYCERTLESFRNNANIHQNKKTVIFTATWDRSGMSAINQWIDILPELRDRYNILVTVHPWTSRKYIDRLCDLEGIFFIENPEVLPYLMISDVMVGDTSSIIAEFCALDKPIVTFKVDGGRRMLKEINQLLQDISVRIENAGQLDAAIEKCLRDPMERSQQRQNANRIMFDRLDGQAASRAVIKLKEWIPRLFQ